MQTLTLCMIVRDEEATLPHFFRAATGLWDELCVVDTGSTDRTTELVKWAGGRVQNILWNDDFSEARNACLEMASTDWVIVLDADEIPSAALVQSARAQLERDERGACVLPFVALSQNGSSRRINHLRMFRRHSNLRYRFRFSEDITTATETYLTKSRLGVGRLAGHIDHLGDTAERQAIRGIRARDAKLIRAILTDDPSDLQGWCAHVAHLIRWAGVQAASPAAHSGLEVLHKSSEQARFCDGSMAERLVVTIAGCFAAQDKNAALDVLNTWEHRIVANTGFYVERAELLAGLDRPAAAAADFQKSLALAHTSVDVQNARVRPLLGLARVYQHQGDLQQAQTLILRALSFDAREPQAIELLAHISQRMAGSSGLQTAARDYIARYGDCPEMQAAFRRKHKDSHPT